MGSIVFLNKQKLITRHKLNIIFHIYANKAKTMKSNFEDKSLFTNCNTKTVHGFATV